MEKKAEDLGPPDRDLLGNLAERRANAARDYLADQAGIDTGRLFGCRPAVEAADKGARVELLL
ncbi:MAG: hypothetical protein HY055_01410, partial [Magnetospirillum sp.]|nr:hypothetical protein [Magnetospirillum sp.]